LESDALAGEVADEVVQHARGDEDRPRFDHLGAVLDAVAQVDVEVGADQLQSIPGRDQAHVGEHRLGALVRDHVVREGQPLAELLAVAEDLHAALRFGLGVEVGDGGARLWNLPIRRDPSSS
jgi:hypothetical protein